MKKRNSYPGQHKHPTNPLWQKEVKKTKNILDWKKLLLSKINGAIPTLGRKVRNVGFRLPEVQIQHDVPIASFFSFDPLDSNSRPKAMWVQFNVWEPFTKEPGKRTLRFSEDTASLMVLVRTPKENGDWDWYLLSRKKYHFGVGDQFVEFSRGWIPGCKPSDMGWSILDRDYPGLRNQAKNIYHTMLGNEVWENTAEFTNKISYQLVVVTLSTPVTKKELKGLLVHEKLKKEYESRPGSDNLSQYDETDLVSEPMVFEIEEAARYLNAHLTAEKDAKPFFGEAYSQACWTRFIATCGNKFPHLVPDRCMLPIP